MKKKKKRKLATIVKVSMQAQKNLMAKSCKRKKDFRAGVCTVVMSSDLNSWNGLFMYCSKETTHAL